MFKIARRLGVGYRVQTPDKRAAMKIDLVALKTKILECERGGGLFSCSVVRQRRMKSNRTSRVQVRHLCGYLTNQALRIRRASFRGTAAQPDLLKHSVVEIVEYPPSHEHPDQPGPSRNEEDGSGVATES